MTTGHDSGSDSSVAGTYRAADGQDYPIPPGYAIGADGQLHPIAAAAAPPVAKTSAWEWNAASILTVAGAAVVFIGAFMPWATIGPFSAAGTEGDGVLTLILAIAAGAMGVPGILKSRKGLLVGSLICATLAFLIGAYDIANISTIADAPFGLDPQVGSGLYLTVLGAIAGIVGPVLAIRRINQRPI